MVSLIHQNEDLKMNTDDLEITTRAPTRKEVSDKEWTDSDGYWILLHAGWQIDGAHAIHESSKREAYKRVADVKRCECPDCFPKKEAPVGASKLGLKYAKLLDDFNKTDEQLARLTKRWLKQRVAMKRAEKRLDKETGERHSIGGKLDIRELAPPEELDGALRLLRVRREVHAKVNGA